MVFLYSVVSLVVLLMYYVIFDALYFMYDLKYDVFNFYQKLFVIFFNPISLAIYLILIGCKLFIL